MLSTLDLLDRCRDSLDRAGEAGTIPARYRAARHGALQAAVSVVVARNPRVLSGPGPQDLWAALAAVAPELAEWADYFAVATGSGQARAVVSRREADDLVRGVETFLTLCLGLLGLPRPDRTAHRLAPAGPLAPRAPRSA